MDNFCCIDVDAVSITEDKEEKVEDGEPVLQDDEVDLREYHPAGGPIIIQLLALPPPPKTINNWTMSQGEEGMEERGSE